MKFLFFALLYFFIRSNWENTIEFGYDQTRISHLVINVIKNRNFPDITQHIFHSVTEDVVTFGPVLVYYLTPIFLLTDDPLLITHILIVLNFLGIIFIYLGVEILYNRRVAFFAALFVIVFPWSVIFSRMIYNPSPLFLFIPLTMLFTVLIIKRDKHILLLFLPFLWGVTVQFHYISVPFACLSFVYLLINYKKIRWVYFFLGLCIGILPWIPVITSEFKSNFQFIRGVLHVRSLLTKESDKNLWQTILIVMKKTYSYLTMQGIDAHIGYGKKILYRTLPIFYFIFQHIYNGLFLLSILFAVVKLIIKRKAKDLFIFLWFLSVPFFIIAFNILKTLSPRYFILSIFPLACMLGDMIDSMFRKIINSGFSGVEAGKFSQLLHKISYGVSSIFTAFFLVFMISYYQFILLNDYNESGFYGWLHPDSAPPYCSTYNALKYALDDAVARGYDTLVFSNDLKEKSNYHSSLSQEFLWTKVFKKEMKYNPEVPFYFIVMGPLPECIPNYKITRIGAYRIFLKPSDW